MIIEYMTLNVMFTLTAIITTIILIIGSITDLKKREVHDYVSYGLVFFGLSSSIIYSIITLSINPLMNALQGFIIGVIIAYTMFYLGQWGGGDSKLIMGLGATIGFNAFEIFGPKNYWLMLFLICTLFVGAAYGLIWSIFLAIKNRKAFAKKAKEWQKKKDISLYRKIILTLTLLSAIAIIFFVPQKIKPLLLMLIAMIFVTFYMWIFVRIIEDSCMIRRIPVAKLTEGDWIYKDIYIKKKYVCGPKDLGISMEKILVLKKSQIRTVWVKEGIPFIPVFFLAYIALIFMNIFSII